MSTASSSENSFRRAHPLALALIERLRDIPHVRVLELGTGSGRNTEALKAAGFSVLGIRDDTIESFASGNAGAMIDTGGSFDGAISTHGLLHGTPATIAAAVAHISDTLKPDAPLFATFASVRDSRYGKGVRLAQHTFASESGDEQGVAHTYFDEPALRELLERFFTMESLQEQNVDGIAGAWAHTEPLRGRVHWIARLRKVQ
jgi:hypothetical protein